MEERENGADERQRRTSTRLRIASALVLGLAATTTGWAAYEASVFSGRHSIELAAAGKSDRLASELEVEANQIRLADLSLLEAFVAARLRDDESAAQFYRARFRPELRQAVAQWLRGAPFEHPGRNPHPLELDAYALPQNQQATAHRRAATAHLELARWYDIVSTSYVLGTVALAFVALFAGLAETSSSFKMRRTLTVMAAIAFLIAAAWVFTRPVELIRYFEEKPPAADPAEPDRSAARNELSSRPPLWD